VLTTTAMLLVGAGAALLAALFEGALAGMQATDAFFVVGAAGALGLARGPRRH